MLPRPAVALLLAALAFPGPVCPALLVPALLLPDDGAETPPPAATPPARPEETKPAPPAAPSETSPEAKALLARAAARQGTADLVGEKSVVRFRAEFGTVVLHSEKGDKGQTSSVEAFALPAAGSKEARLRSEWSEQGKKRVLGHNGSFGWMWTEEEGLRRFTNRERDAEDIKDVDRRRRMLRLALRVFFLGNLATDIVPVALGPDEEKAFPVRDRGETFKVACIRFDRTAATGVGEPPLRLYLDAKSLDPVAAHLLAGSEGESSWLLTFAYDAKDTREAGAIPAGIRVPNWIELFEIPADPKAAPSLVLQAAVTRLEIDPAKIPDELFAAPR